MVPALTGPVLVAAVLLALTAPGKWRRPDDTVRALRAVRLPAGRVAVRALAVGEVVLATAVVLSPSRPVLGLLALAYLGFGAFVLRALRAGTPLASCGCFGRSDTPPTRGHLGVVLAAAVLAGGAAVTGSASLADVLASPWAGLPLLATVGVGVLLAWTVLAVLPQVHAAAARTPVQDSTFRLVSAR
jgi:hypothetical protein